MKSRDLVRLILVVLVAPLSLLACPGLFSSLGGAPSADAGADQTVELGEQVTLDASASEDPNGDSLEYEWSFLSVAQGSALAKADITDWEKIIAYFTPDVVGTYILELEVDDGDNSATAQTTITVEEPTATNQAPVADAGQDQSVTTGDLVQLDGTASSDADGDSLAFTWSFASLPSGSALVDADISNRTTDSASFTPDTEGTYEVELLVDDGTDQNTDLVTITAVAAATVPSGAIGEWLFNGNMNDTSGNNNDGTGSGVTLIADRHGNADSAYNFGVSGEINAPFSDLGDAGYDLTVSFWMRADFSQTAADLGNMFSINTGSAIGELHLSLDSDNFWAVSGGGSQVLLPGFSNVATANTWVHVAVVYTTGSGNIELFLDGSSAGSGTLSLANNTMTQVSLGKRPGQTSFDGDLDDFRVYDFVLTSTEISQLAAE